MSSVILVHPAKVVGRNEMPFGRDTHVAPSNIVLDKGPRSPMGRGDLGSQNRQLHSDAAFCQITLALVIIIVYRLVRDLTAAVIRITTALSIESTSTKYSI